MNVFYFEPLRKLTIDWRVAEDRVAQFLFFTPCPLRLSDNFVFLRICHSSRFLGLYESMAKEG